MNRKLYPTEGGPQYLRPSLGVQSPTLSQYTTQPKLTIKSPYNKSRPFTTITQGLNPHPLQL